jgi:hypothetical protein
MSSVCTGTGRTDTVKCSLCKTVCPDGKAPTGLCSGATAVDVTKCEGLWNDANSPTIMYEDASQAVLAVTVELAMPLMEFGSSERTRFTSALKLTATGASYVRITSVYETQNSSIVRRASHETYVHVTSTFVQAERNVPLTVDDSNVKFRTVLLESEAPLETNVQLRVPAEDRGDAKAVSHTMPGAKTGAGSGQRSLKLRGLSVRKLSSMSVVILSEVAYPNKQAAVAASQSLADAALNANLASYALPKAKLTQRPVLIESKNATVVLQGVPQGGSPAASSGSSGVNVGAAIGGAAAGVGLALMCFAAVMYFKCSKRVRAYA